MTKEAMIDILESIVSYFWQELKASGCDFTISARRDRTSTKNLIYIPEINITCDDPYIKLTVETKPITRGEDGAQGFEFIPTLTNAGLTQVVDYDNRDDVVNRFKRWAAAADLAEKIYSDIEFYPSDYEDE